jgi:hypothetical protein
MIPTIEYILNGLLDGEYTLDQAINLMNNYVESAGLRDHFAGLAMQGDIAGLSRHLHQYDGNELRIKAEAAYLMADAMLEARKCEP